MRHPDVHISNCLLTGVNVMGGIQTIVVGDFGKPTAKNDVSHKVNSLIQENELLQEDNRQLRAAARFYRSTVRELMNKCGMQYPGD